MSHTQFFFFLKYFGVEACDLEYNFALLCFSFHTSALPQLVSRSFVAASGATIKPLRRRAAYFVSSRYAEEPKLISARTYPPRIVASRIPCGHLTSLSAGLRPYVPVFLCANPD